MTKDQIQEILIEITSKVSGNPVENVALNAHLAQDLGLDSIDMFDILALLSEKTSLDLERDDFKDVSTVQDFIDVLFLLLQKNVQHSNG